MNNIMSPKDIYLKWLDKSFKGYDISDNTYQITTPYLDSYNDFIQIYVIKNNNHILLTDDGKTLMDLSISGCNFDTQTRSDILKTILQIYGVRKEGYALTISATQSTLAQQLHFLLQTILSVTNLFCLVRSSVQRIFTDDVALFLDNNHVRYVRNMSLKGKTGYSHNYDFIIPKSSNAPERYLKAMNKMNKDKAENLIFTWLDTKETRDKEAEIIAILNNENFDIPVSAIEALDSYNIAHIDWSKREEPSIKSRLCA